MPRLRLVWLALALFLLLSPDLLACINEMEGASTTWGWIKAHWYYGAASCGLVTVGCWLCFKPAPPV